MRDICLNTHELVYRGVHHTLADGNCLFNSLSFPSGEHQIIRQRIVDHIEQHWKYYSQFLADNERPFYCERMRRLGTWGDELVIKAFVDAAGMAVNVYDTNTRNRIQSYKPKHFNSLTKTRNLLYDGLHYNVWTKNSPRL
jgi:hypothetical protein